MQEFEKKIELQLAETCFEREIIGIEYRSNIWKSYLYHFLIGCHLVSGILMPFFMSWGKLTFFEIMLLQSYSTILVFLFGIPCSSVADYLNRKTSLILGGLITAIATLIFCSYPNIVVFFIGETFWALGAAFISGADQALMYDTLKKMEREEEISKITARNGSFILAAILICGPIGSLLTLVLPLNIIFGLMFFPFIGAAFVASTFKEPNGELERTTECYSEVIKSGIKELRNNPILRILAFEIAIIDGLAFLMIWMWQIYLGDLGVPIIYFGLIAAFLVSGEIILRT